MGRQVSQKQWREQWQEFCDDELFLFEDWIYPNKLADFEGKEVLECGCGGGQHTSFVAPICKRIVAIDLNAVEIARNRNAKFDNVEFLEDDIATMSLGEQFDVVFSIGVVHHTDDPETTLQNIKAHVKPGGRLILWVYSKEGNWVAEKIVENFRRYFLSRASTKSLLRYSRFLTLSMYLPIYTVYLLPLRFLPYYSYFGNFRKLGFNRNLLNVFDKLNAPQVQFISLERVKKWLPDSEYFDTHIEHYKGVSWRASATRKF